MNQAFRSVGALTATIAAAMLAACVAPDGRSEAAVPRFRVDTAWPLPLPNGWILGQVSGIATDAQDHIWVLQRPGTLTEDERGAALNPPHSKCCVPAPSVLEFDAKTRRRHVACRRCAARQGDDRGRGGESARRLRRHA